MSKAARGYSKSKRGKSFRNIGDINAERANEILQRKSKKRTIKQRNQDKKLNLLIAHDNRKEWHTTKSHKLAEELDGDPKYNTIYDKQKWNRGEKTSPTETDQREREMVQEADLVVRVVPPSSKTGERNEGAEKEVRKAINAGKPVIEIFERGARDSPNRPIQEKNYSKMVQIHLQPGEHLKTGLKRGIEELKLKGILKE